MPLYCATLDHRRGAEQIYADAEGMMSNGAVRATSRA